MAEIPEKIRGVIDNYLRDLSSEIPIEKAVLFGSYAKGNYNKESDIDIAVFSDYFKNIERVEGIKYLLKKARKYRDVDLEPIPFTKKDYYESDGFTQKIITTGIEIKLRYTRWSSWLNQIN